ncbi:hypothetical protein JY404_12400, partial [Stenotrophomonas maltophilia]|uniref:hypothetical protein n=1 Tax=Stenotrophomonas sp. GD04064 TaxID=2975430 RepID=UPI00244A53D3
MTREPSTLFAPGVLPGPDGIELLPMPADIRAIYDAAQRNTPFSKDVDDALAAHRNAHGEAEQIEHAQGSLPLRMRLGILLPIPCSSESFCWLIPGL